jgi:acyl-CoA synthetase (AMP-forming)/AMP-acid ligase II
MFALELPRYGYLLAKSLLLMGGPRGYTLARRFETHARSAAKDDAFLIWGEQTFSYAEANAIVNRYAYAYLQLGLRAGDAVAILMDNRPEFLWHFLAAGKLGVVAALINTHNSGEPLAHALRVCNPKMIVVGSEHAAALGQVRDQIDAAVLVYAELDPDFEARPALPLWKDLADGASDADPKETSERLQSELCAFIYTSGTTGLPKAAVMRSQRVHAIAQLIAGPGWALRPGDVIYNCLPLYHTNGLVVATCAVICRGATMALARKFSASRFWDDIRRTRATGFIYIGELCRYLMSAPPRDADRDHRVRVVVGNGMRPDIWAAFQERFGIARVAEFYGSTEGNAVALNIDGTVGSVGHMQPNCALARWDDARDDFARDEQGFLIRAKAGEAGVLLGRMSAKLARFDGYHDQRETERKIVRNAFKRGDAWFNTGDLLRIDAFRRLYFVDRLGDTFRWKGENVSTFEVQEQLASWPGATEVNVYGVAVPGTEGRAGMAALTLLDGAFDAASFKAHVDAHLAPYARPLFVRVQPAIETTSTFKLKKADLRAQGFDPGAISDPMYVRHPKLDAYVPLTAALFNELSSGSLRL